MNDVTRILSAIEQGDSGAAEKLLPLVYDELRKLATARLAHEKPGQTLQATALVHEAYLRLVGTENKQKWDGRHLAFLDRTLLAALDDAAAGQLDGLVVSMPPQHGKSELCSKYFPAWYLGTFPDRRVLPAGYQADFAAQWGRKARDPSKGTDSRYGDYSAFVMLQLADDGVMYIDADLEIRNIQLIVDKGVDLCAAFRPGAFAVETNQFQELLAYELDRTGHSRGIDMPLYHLPNVVSKAVRILFVVLRKKETTPASRSSMASRFSALRPTSPERQRPGAGWGVPRARFGLNRSFGANYSSKVADLRAQSGQNWVKTGLKRAKAPFSRRHLLQTDDQRK